MRRNAFGMKALPERSSATANLLAPGRYKPISKPPLAATENFKNSRRSIWIVFILYRPWRACRQPGGSPFGSADRCRSDRRCLSSLGRCLHRSVVAFRVTGQRRSSVVRIGNSRTEVHLRQSKRVATDDSGLAGGPRWSSPPCPSPATPGQHRIVLLPHRDGQYRHHIAPCHNRTWSLSGRG